MLTNPQKPEPQIKRSTGEELELVDVFFTLQGEGPFTGHASVFIRLAGCNLQCPWCDTDYTTNRQFYTVEHIVKQLVAKHIITHPRTKLVVITGGEPLRQNIVPLITLLHETHGVHVQIESNGVFPPSFALTDLIREGIVTYIVSPKTSRISATAELWASAYKYVISADSIDRYDGLPKQALGHKAEPFIARPPVNYNGKIYVNPCDSQDPIINRANMIACRDSALKFGYRFGVQLHKLVDLP